MRPRVSGYEGGTRDRHDRSVIVKAGRHDVVRAISDQLTASLLHKDVRIRPDELACHKLLQPCQIV